MDRQVRKSVFDVDLLHGSVFRSILIFSVPILISTIFQNLYNTVDTMIVGNVLGDQSLAAIGASSVIYELLVGFAVGVGNGMAIVTARSFGSHDEETIKKSVAACLVIGIAVSAIVTLGGSAVLHPLLELLDTPAEILEESYSYVKVIVLYTLVLFAYNLGSGILRAIGNSIMPLVFLVLSSVVNIGLDYWFIAGLGKGVRGAAEATVISQGLSAVLCLVYILICTPVLVPRRRHFRIDRALYRDMLGQGLSMGFMGSIVSCGTVILQYGINGLGTLTIAAHTAARKLYGFCSMPMMALSMGASTFVGQNCGAKKFDRIRSAMRDLYLFDIAYAVVITVIILFTARTMMALVSGSSEELVLSSGSKYLVVVGPFYAVLGVLIQSRFALQGIGSKLLPLVSSVIELCGKILFVVFLIKPFGYDAVIFCEPVIWCVMTAQLLWALWRNPMMKKETDGKQV